MGVDIKDIKDLIITVNSTDIETVEIEKSDIKIMISKANPNKESLSTKNIPVVREVVGEIAVESEEVSIVEEDLFIVKSPVVGVFYQSPSPGEEAFVKPGSKVEEGDSLCIVEAMKIMNEIESEVSGEVVEILVENEEIVQYGQALMKIRR